MLRDPLVPPSEQLLKKILGKSNGAYSELLKRYEESDFTLIPQWRYYNDGKAWLCKVAFKSKTVFWLSVWDGYFKTSFFFRERDCPGILELDIDESYKQQIESSQIFGKLHPVVLEIKEPDQLEDLRKLIMYKKGLK
ncbi:MAG: DUF3788 family protein [Rikenellaceae bacterium]|nr:DUF3788 family protein [Rikenellaceae bacterium]